MQIFIQSTSYELWNITSKGPLIPTKVVDGVTLPKVPQEYTTADHKSLELNSKAIGLLYCALTNDEFSKISRCTSAKEIWDTLEVTYEGKSQVKEAKINMLVCEYEMFKMKKDESIRDMFARFNAIINPLSSLGKTYTNSELVRKILRSLPKQWDVLTTTLLQSKELSSMTLSDLDGNLVTQELAFKAREIDEGKTSKSMALKALQEEEEPQSEECENEEDEDMAFISHKLKKFFSRRNQGRRFNKGDSSKRIPNRGGLQIENHKCALSARSPDISR